MQYGFYFDQSRCIGCNACTVACKDFNQVNPGPVRWRRQETHEVVKDGKPVFESLVMSCNHCENPACKGACPIGAIEKFDDGLVLVDRKKCQGYKSCITACPFAAPHIADNKQEPIKKEKWAINHPVQKCTFCWERLQDGLPPVCVAACPVHALDYGDKADLMRNNPDAVELNVEDFPYAFKPGAKTDTKPSLLIKKRKQIKVTDIV